MTAQDNPRNRTLKPQWDNPLGIVERIIITGKLVLDTPARLGGGLDDDMLDMPLLRDAHDGRALLPGSSIAGAVRDYLRAYIAGYGKVEEKKSTLTRLFGRMQGDDEGDHSLLIVSDALGDSSQPLTELRDGVAIDFTSRTAAQFGQGLTKHGRKFDIELLAAGAIFDLQFELRVTNDANRNELVAALATALTGLQKGEIGLGARKRRGYGQCHIDGWMVALYDMADPKHLIGWLDNDTAGSRSGGDLFALLNVTPSVTDARERFVLTASFAIDGSLLIRSGTGGVQSPDVVHLHSQRSKDKNDTQPIMSGTSLAGALRARALRIANTITPVNQTAINWVDCMFGPRAVGDKELQQGELRASRVHVKETVIQNSIDNLVQQRVKIDRFTGGAFPTALFDQQPLFGKPDTCAKVEILLENPSDAEIGMLLLLLKDLWTGDLPIGGESSVGRGRLKGIQATMTGNGLDCQIQQNGSGLEVTGADRMEDCVGALNKELGHA